ncbi:MAG TPA: hypothetical protein PLT22_07400, partial [Flexilinea sp.]|nr:hypothetical protein [Flexilinea sp.]
GYLRLSKGELENEKDLLASLEGGRQEGFPLDVLSEKSNCLVNEKRLLASQEGKERGMLSQVDNHDL